MAQRAYLWVLVLSTALALMLWLVVVFLMDPQTAGKSSWVLFYAGGFLALGGLGTLGIIWLKSLLGRVLTQESLAMEIRRGFLLGLYVFGLAGLSQAKIFTWWVAVLYLGLILLIELNYLTKRI